MKKRLSVALLIACDMAATGVPKDVAKAGAKADVWLPSLIKPITG
ncbi:hypothetical protein ACVIW2_008087 [Bradyrhizobium huanghuaihaiense]|uniref:Uncharacterized protein n=1 Tax=Bradyrhizobium huanghuaihaiense TaxID=990078 RepID=A0A562RAI0_9BRAD|nr:hypothetical protein [Bradyrhizobium huanghuaihaiense]TWI65564.1 hypothetical protein IQ16_05303 [Bradyrhizobium huanghuaihaiense]